ncbi:hypothetical protein FF38_13913 [Lucilia cuprina]|uniref:Uncharacterized protein n=1 Tax=Lucilia cuprina TaxID=7375 RepID=A0A0L0BMJ9_LUCCU|nr:hypothetical protein FF38_13913 [Lucilia cuprina]
MLQRDSLGVVLALNLHVLLLNWFNLIINIITMISSISIDHNDFNSLTIDITTSEKALLFSVTKSLEALIYHLIPARHHHAFRTVPPQHCHNPSHFTELKTAESFMSLKEMDFNQGDVLPSLVFNFDLSKLPATLQEVKVAKFLNVEGFPSQRT